MKRYLIVIVFVVLSCCALSSQLSAQWKLIASGNGAVSCVYFLNKVGAPATGFFTTVKGGTSRTTDGGNTWQSVNISAVDFSFVDSLIGYSAGNGVSRTTDGGKTWKATNLTNETHAVYYNKKKNCVFASCPLTEAKVSFDNGQTWSNDGPKRMLGYATTNDMIAIRTAFDTLFEYTQDGGLTWNSSTFGAESWQPMAIPRTKIFLASSETFIGTNRLYRSINGGITWGFSYDFAATGKMTGTIVGDSNKQYIQTDNGMYLSTNTGLSWTYICGPGNNFDTRFWAIGDTVYTGDFRGNLWRSPTAGNGSIKLNTSLSTTELQFFTANCAKSLASFNIFDGSNCEEFRTEILQLSIVGSSHFLLVNPPKIPGFVDKATPISVAYYAGPNLKDSAVVYIQYRKDGNILDTVIHLLGTRSPSRSFSISPSAVGSIIESPCVAFDTIITVTNGPCDTLKIDKVSMLLGSAIEILSPTSPRVLAPDSSCQVRIRLTASTKGIYNDSLIVIGTNDSGTTALSIPIAIKIKTNITATEEINPGVLQIGRVSTCAPVRKRIYFRNPICRDIRLLSTSLISPQSVYKITSNLLLPLLLAPGAKDSIEIEFAPKSAGSFPTRLHLQFLFEGKVQDTIIPIQGTGTTMIAVNLKDSALLFDTISTCESGVRETFLENVGCDSIEITQIQQRNDKFTILEPALPCWVRSGEQKKIVLRFGSKNVGASSDKILIYATIGGSATLSLPLELSAYSISEPAAILLSTNKITLDTISPCFKLDTTIFLFNPMRCDSLQIDSIVLHSSNNFSVVASSNTIAPNDSINIHLIFTPDYQTIERDSLFITMSSPHSKIDTVITFTALVEGTTRSLIISDYNINFDTLSICDTKDTIVTLYNSGCDTLMISKADFSGLGFYSSASLPITIPPYTIKDLQINASPDTTTAKRINNSMLTLSSNSIASPNSISLRSQIRYPSMVTMCLVPKQKLFEVGGLGHVDIKTNSTSITGLKTLDLAMHYNRDMLRFNQALSINTITTTDSLLFHIVGNPEIAISSDSSLGDLTFDVFLAKDTLTKFVVDSLQLNPGDLQYQNCSFAYLPTMTSEIYGLDFGCGGRMILQYLLSHTTSIHHIIISPVPTFDNLQLSLYSEQIQNARLKITSAIGIPVMYSDNVLNTGANYISIETRALPSGTYQLQLQTKDASYWQSFVKLK